MCIVALCVARSFPRKAEVAALEGSLALSSVENVELETELTYLRVSLPQTAEVAALEGSLASRQRRCWGE